MKIVLNLSNEGYKGFIAALLSGEKQLLERATVAKNFGNDIVVSSVCEDIENLCTMYADMGLHERGMNLAQKLWEIDPSKKPAEGKALSELLSE